MRNARTDVFAQPSKNDAKGAVVPWRVEGVACVADPCYGLNSIHLNPERSILVVEDNPGDVRLIREALKGLEPTPRIDACGDADEALAYLQNAAAGNGSLPGLILLDFNLPKSGSRELLHTIKEDRTLRLIPVAVLTTSDSERDIRDAYALRANCYIRKPVDLDSFFDTIRITAKFWLQVASSPGESLLDLR